MLDELNVKVHFALPYNAQTKPIERDFLKIKELLSKPWMENISIEDLPNDDLKFVAQCAGIKVALTLIFCLPGLIVNIPKHALKKLKERYILKEYDGTKMTLNRLVIECELSQRHVEAVIRKYLKKSKKPPAESLKK